MEITKTLFWTLSATTITYVMQFDAFLVGIFGYLDTTAGTVAVGVSPAPVTDTDTWLSGALIYKYTTITSSDRRFTSPPVLKYPLNKGQALKIHATGITTGEIGIVFEVPLKKST